jgi:hypothetical protein
MLLPSKCHYWIKVPKNCTLFNEYAYTTQGAKLLDDATATPPPAELEETTMEQLYARILTLDSDDNLPSNPCAIDDLIEAGPKEDEDMAGLSSPGSTDNESKDDKEMTQASNPGTILLGCRC